MAHTPGPWRVNDSEGAGNVGPDIFPFMVEAGDAERSTGPVICEIYGDIAELDAAANAALIAAAPELLEALEEAASAFGLVEAQHGLNPILQRARERAKSAIAKATGAA